VYFKGSPPTAWVVCQGSVLLECGTLQRTHRLLRSRAKR